MGDRLSSGSGSAYAFMIADLHGNVVAAIAPGSSPSFVNAYRYDAYGETVCSYTQTGSISIPWRYQGRILESAAGGTDLYDFAARSYDPSLGTFTSFDSVNGTAQNPLTLNRYLYANANPATMVDPTGHCSGWGIGPVCTDAVPNPIPVLHNLINSPVNPAWAGMKAIDTLNDAARTYAPTFQHNVIDHLPQPLQTVWSAASSPTAFLVGGVKGFDDGAMDVVNQTVDGIPAMINMGATLQKCQLMLQCGDLINSASHFDLGQAANGLKNTVSDVGNHFVDKVKSGDMNGAGIEAGHAGVAVAQIALALYGGYELIGPKLMEMFPSLAGRLPGLTAAVDGAAGTDSTPLFRSMTAGTDDLPQVGNTARTLGPRIPTDIVPSPEGIVSPGTGGMSTSTSPWDLPPFRRPPAYGGTGSDPVWKISSDRLGPDLRPAVDPRNPSHIFIEPARPMPIEDYQCALAATRGSWSRC